MLLTMQQNILKTPSIIHASYSFGDFAWMFNKSVLKLVRNFKEQVFFPYSRIQNRSFYLGHVYSYPGSLQNTRSSFLLDSHCFIMKTQSTLVILEATIRDFSARENKTSPSSTMLKNVQLKFFRTSSISLEYAFHKNEESYVWKQPTQFFSCSHDQNCISRGDYLF